MTNKIAVVMAQDMHINSTVGLCPPLIELDDGGTYRASRGQKWLWSCWVDYIERVRELSANYRIVVILNGDLGELDTKRRSAQLITGNKATIQRFAIDTLSPMVDLAEAVFVVRGTLAHVGKSAWLDESLAKDFDNVRGQSENIGSWWHLRHVFSGVRFDVSHHARMGGIPRTKKNAANMLAYDTISNYYAIGAPPPNIIYRGHNHQRADSGANFGDTRVWLGPAWQLATEFVHRIGQENSLADIGGDIFLCDGGRYEWIPVAYRPEEAKRVWALKM
jgi:hypothetical protein